MMKKAILLSTAVCLFMSSAAFADTFGTGANQFDIEFVTISGDASSANGTNISGVSPANDKYRTFSDPGNFRIGKFEISNGQWNKFKNSLGLPVTGIPTQAYDANPKWISDSMPSHNVSWYEAAQFVNWLNTSNGHHAAYRFDSTQGTSWYSLNVWDAADAWGGTNLYRHKDAYYFLPTEDEWVKAAYWNKTTLQTYSSIGDLSPTQSGWNFYDNGYATDTRSPWDVGSGSEELNGTYDMMGNVWEWTEDHFYVDRDLYNAYTTSSSRGLRGGTYSFWGPASITNLTSSSRFYSLPLHESIDIGFRVASVPEPGSLLLLGLGGLALLRRRG
jgi:formylglycine-generating enzyme required for sulfatase activity